ncbi:MAG: hypothetical protein AM325_005775 [Candidatus Thorarchaeota archaeon SMTZ1-45]|nr:MAG: hypothetical protein AM325_07535 [Candidatus Thorarchaeota archaeon SMTZ1-45]
MKNYRDIEWIKWVIPAAVIVTWVTRILIEPIEDIILESALGIGLMALVILTYVLWRRPIVMIWDEATGIMAILRTWTIEVQAGCLLSSVPLGIDVSLSANRVLKAMSERFSKENLCELRFFVCRPLANSSTLVGMQVVRRSLRLMNGVGVVQKLSEKVHDDVTILESALHSSYPHTPVDRAGLYEMQLVNSGGIVGG